MKSIFGISEIKKINVLVCRAFDYGAKGHRGSRRSLEISDKGRRDKDGRDKYRSDKDTRNKETNDKDRTEATSIKKT